jgi:hypothetical protein
MARTISQIKQQILTEKATYSELNVLNNPSTTSLFNLWAYITAVCISVLENLQDVFITEVETIVNRGVVGSKAWLDYQIRRFQYTNILILDTVTFLYKYANSDVSKEIISRVSISDGINNDIIIKVAKNEPPATLTTDEMNALNSYLKQIVTAGVTTTLISTNSDKVRLYAQIYYEGQYSTVIKDNVIIGINNYLATLPFDTQIRVSSIQDAIQNILGVKDVIINNLEVRTDSTALGSGSKLVVNNQVLTRQVNLYSGYAVEETTALNGFIDTLTFIAL